MDREPKVSSEHDAPDRDVQERRARAESPAAVQRTGRVRDAPTPMAAVLAGTIRDLPGLDETRIRRSPGAIPSSPTARGSGAAARVQRAHRQSGPRISRSADGVIRRDFLADEIKKRRGGATGMDAEDLERETATERFVAGRSDRETAEAQNVSADPMLDRQKIQGAVSAKKQLGAEGLPQLLEQGRQRRAEHEASMHDLGDDTESVASSLQQTRIGMDSFYARYGDEVAEQRQLTRSLDDVRSAVEEARAVATWDATQLGEFESAATEAVTALRPGSQSQTDSRLAFDAARAKIAAAVSRAQQDTQWMESLLPHTESIITEAIGAGNKTVMNNNMTISWRSITTNGSEAERDPDKLQIAVDSLASEIDRKTAFDAGLAAGRLKGGNLKERTALIALLQSKATINRRIKEILALETDTATLKKLATALHSVDGLARMLSMCADRALLIKLAQKNRVLVEPDRLRSIVAAKCGAGDVDALSEMAKADERFFEPATLELMLSRWPDRTRLATVAKLAKGNVAALLRITKKLGNAAQTDFVLDGEGCSPLDIVDRYLQADQVWLGETAPAPTLRPNGTTYDQIESVAVPKLKDGSGPAVGGYAGNREWANSHGPPDMLLPKRTTSGAVITYLEFDLKPYQTPWQRGQERYVKGSDGRRYYTNDHYQSFKLVP